MNDENNDEVYKIKTNKQDFIKNEIDTNNKNIKDILKLETLQDNNDKNEPKISEENIIQISKTDSDLQELDYEEAIINDNRTYLKMHWGYLIDSQIILGTFFVDNKFELFIIKLSFLISTFQISFFLNTLFYTDEYISNAYHNDGVLDFISGLPKSIYSFVATLIITNLLKMLSNSKNELMKIIRRNIKFNDYANIVNIKLAKFRKKLIVYFILLISLSSFFYIM